MKTVATILALAGLLATAVASCPNQCSGHGTCGDNDKCECYKQTGTTWRQRVGWTGADCSQRTCPLGVAYDTLQTNRGVEISPIKFDVGKDFTGATNSKGSANFLQAFARNYQLGETKTFQIRISDVSDASTANTYDTGDQIQFQWKLDSHSAYSAPQNLISTTATAVSQVLCTQQDPCELMNNEGVTDTGIFVYVPSTYDANALFGGGATTTLMEEGNTYEFTFDYQEGRAYEYGNSNLAHQESECSGRGVCDRGSGRCTCDSGFTGEACQRTVCPNDCSGNGVCQDLRRFASDYATASGSSLSYTGAYDARKQMGCLCDEGFRGPDCSQIECPSGADPMGHYGGNGNNADGAAGPAMDCSGRGLCDYSSGSCSCFKGYYGERCEYQTNFV
jgi:hypothetical protein